MADSLAKLPEMGDGLRLADLPIRIVPLDMITPEDWPRIKRIYMEAASLPPPEREEFLDRWCADDRTLRAQVEALLRSGDDAPDHFLDPPNA